MPIKCWFVLMPIGYIYFSAVLYFNDMAWASFYFFAALLCFVFWRRAVCVLLLLLFSLVHTTWIKFLVFIGFYNVCLFWFGVAFKALSSCYFYVILFLNAHCYRTTITKLITYKSLFVVFNGLLLFGHIVLGEKAISTIWPPPPLAPPRFARILLAQHSTSNERNAAFTFITFARNSTCLHPIWWRLNLNGIICKDTCALSSKLDIWYIRNHRQSGGGVVAVKCALQTNGK